MNNELRAYFAKIGRKGGLCSKRVLSSEKAREMVKVREARRAFRKFYSQCFWSFDPKTKIEFKDIAWVCEQLKKHGNREAWKLAGKLCR